MRKLTKDQLTVLTVADAHGEVRAATRIALDACLKLAAYDYLSEHDAAPGVFTITREGEAMLAKALAKAA